MKSNYLEINLILLQLKHRFTNCFYRKVTFSHVKKVNTNFESQDSLTPEIDIGEELKEISESYELPQRRSKSTKNLKHRKNLKVLMHNHSVESTQNIIHEEDELEEIHNNDQKFKTQDVAQNMSKDDE